MRSVTQPPYLNRRVTRASAVAAVTAALVMLLAVSSATAATTFVIRGGGYGHGVGMSQYGAYGYALHGKSYRWILGHYYRGTRLGTTDPNQTVRVLLATGSASFAGADRGGSTKLAPGTIYYVKALADGDLQIVTAAGKKVGHPAAAPLTVTGPGFLQVPALGTYRGSLQFTADGAGGVQTVNALGLDDYVRGVVASEMPSAWAPQALETQAVAARTYAITTSVDGNGFDLYDDTRSQVYGGVNSETPASNDAVSATAGQVVTYNGTPAVTYFFSSSGGHTESIQNVWPGATPEPWLRGVPDPYDGAGGNPYHSWGAQMSVGAAASKLGALVKGRLVGIEVTEHGVSPRILEAEVVGTKGASMVTGAELQRIFGLRTTFAAFTTITTVASAGELGGAVYPAPSHGTVTVQSDAGGGWHTVTTAPLGPQGTYTVVLPGSGRYRIRYAKLDGPAVAASQPTTTAIAAARGQLAAEQALTGALPSWVRDYAGPHVWPTARNRRAVRPLPLVLRAP